MLIIYWYALIKFILISRRAGVAWFFFFKKNVFLVHSLAYYGLEKQKIFIIPYIPWIFYDISFYFMDFMVFSVNKSTRIINHVFILFFATFMGFHIIFFWGQSSSMELATKHIIWGGWKSGMISVKYIDWNGTISCEESIKSERFNAGGF